MSTISSSISRVSSSQLAQQTLGSLQQTNVDLLKLQEQLSTGERINRPSDDPSAIGSVISLSQILQTFNQRLNNLDLASNVVNVTDQAYSDISDQLLQAQSVASSQIGAGSDAETRTSQATIINGILDSILEISNRDVQGVHLFAGSSSSTQPFVEKFGGYQYVGSTTNLTNNLSDSFQIDVNNNGADALGALSSRVQGTVDLDPNATASTRLVNVNGARGVGVTLGSVAVTVNGTTSSVDLTSADTLGDIVKLVNNSLGSAGSLAVSAKGFTLTANAGNTIQISDLGSNAVAADLGLNITASSGSTVGGDIDPRITNLTDLTQLGASVDLSGGLKITNGEVTKVIDTSGVTTVQDLINTIDAADIGVKLQINSDATGFNLVNTVSGTALSIGENAGGTTAGDLGIRSFTGSTQLSDFNGGLGVQTIAGQNDLRIQLGDGSTIDVNLDGATTVQGVLDKINTAGGGNVTASLASDGNGIELTDNVGGGGDFKVEALNNSTAAADLGLLKNAGASSTLSGDDNATVETDSIFSHLVDLRNALLNNDSNAITIAGQKLQADSTLIATQRAKVGVTANQIAGEQSRTQDRQTQTKALLSDIRDTDYTTAITRLTQLQQQLQANLAATSKILNLSLLNFLQ